MNNNSDNNGSYLPRRYSEKLTDPFITNIMEEPANYEDSSVSSVEGSTKHDSGNSAAIESDIEDVKYASRFKISTVRRHDSDAADNLQAFGHAYASRFSFWKSFFLSGFLGGIMGLLAFGFFWTFNFGITNLFFTDSYRASIVSTHFHPKPYWIWLPTVGGAVIGLVKLLPLGRYSYPSKVHGFFRKVQSFEVHPNEAPIVIVVAILSLACGGTVGPEAALGWMGCGIAIVLHEALEKFGDHFKVKLRHFPDSKLLQFLSDPLSGVNQSVLALDAISAGLGAMFPTPALAILIMHELTLAAGLNIFAANYMERVSTSLFGAIVSWTIFNMLGGKHVLPNLGDGSFEKVPGAASSWKMELCLADNPYHQQHFMMDKMFTAAVLGLVGSGVGLMCLLEMGVMRNIANRVRSRFKKKKRVWIATFFLPVIAGFICGIVGYNYPLTFGDGSFQLSYITKNLVQSEIQTYQDDPAAQTNQTQTDYPTSQTDDLVTGYTSGYLIRTVIADLSLLAICQGFGFVGGQIFPTMFAGYLCGIVAFDRYHVSFDVAVPCLMCAVPCAFVPTPFTFVFMVAILFGLDGIHTTYVLIAVITSFGANCGLGLVQQFLLRKIRTDLQASRRPNDFHTGFSGDANDPFSSRHLGGKAPVMNRDRVDSDGFGFGLNPRAMSEILTMAFFADEDEEDTDDDDDDDDDNGGLFNKLRAGEVSKDSDIFSVGETKKRIKSVNDATLRKRHSLVNPRGSILGPRAMTATFGMQYQQQDNTGFGALADYGGYGDIASSITDLHHVYDDDAMINDDEKRTTPSIVKLGDVDDNNLDALRDPNNTGGLVRAKSSGPGIQQSPPVTNLERERGRGPTSIEARVAAAKRYGQKDLFTTTKF